MPVSVPSDQLLCLPDIYAFERFLVQQDTEAMFAADLAHQSHYKQVMVVRQVAFFEDGSQLELVRGDFIVACFQRNA